MAKLTLGKIFFASMILAIMLLNAAAEGSIGICPVLGPAFEGGCDDISCKDACLAAHPVRGLGGICKDQSTSSVDQTGRKNCILNFCGARRIDCPGGSDIVETCTRRFTTTTTSEKCTCAVLC